MTSKYNYFISALLMLLFFVSPKDAFGQWQDQSDDLPGISNNSGLLIAAGVVVTGGIAYLIIKNKQKKKQNASSFLEQHPGDLQARSLYDNIKRAGEQAPVELVVGQSQSNNLNMHGGGVSVGLRYKF